MRPRPASDLFGFLQLHNHRLLPKALAVYNHNDNNSITSRFKYPWPTRTRVRMSSTQAIIASVYNASVVIPENLSSSPEDIANKSHHLKNGRFTNPWPRYESSSVWRSTVLLLPSFVSRPVAVSISPVIPAPALPSLFQVMVDIV